MHNQTSETLPFKVREHAKQYNGQIYEFQDLGARIPRRKMCCLNVPSYITFLLIVVRVENKLHNVRFTF